MLILFDIDMTLISTGGCGLRSMLAAGRELYGPGFHGEGVPVGGRLDPLIIQDLFRVSGVPWSVRAAGEFREVYTRHLEAALREARDARALPGAKELVAQVGGDGLPGAISGVLTGNFETTGSLKLRVCGIDPGAFAVRVWGDESPHEPPRRADLVEVAMARCAARRRVAPEDVVVIGDTPHDVEAARAHGCRSLGVATGRSGEAELREAGATWVVPDLRETDRIVGWLSTGR